MRIAAIDPGTSCGYAWTDDKRVRAIHSGVWDLKPKRHEGGGMRFVRLERYMEDLKPELVFYEEVRAHKGTTAAQVYGGIVATLQSWCERHGIPYLGLPVATVKRFATGRGNANKAAILGAAFEKWGEPVKGYDQADALWILACGLEEVPR